MNNKSIKFLDRQESFAITLIDTGCVISHLEKEIGPTALKIVDRLLSYGVISRKDNNLKVQWDTCKVRFNMRKKVYQYTS